MLAKPLFTRLPDERWDPDPSARGPFIGMQGGAAAALMCASVEAMAEGSVASVTTHFLRPVPMAPLEVGIRLLRGGRRVSVIDAELFSDEGLVAVQRATAIRPIETVDLPAPRAQRTEPDGFATSVRRAPHGLPWLMDAFDVRKGPDGIFWFRQLRPVAGACGSMASVLPAADWAHGLCPPLGASEHPAMAIPNPDLSVHLFRPPVGDWIGVQAVTAWSRYSIGAGWGALHDAEGLLGRVAMSVAVSPPQER